MASANPWDAVFDRVTHVRTPGFVCATPVTDAELDQAEAQLNTRFPLSYRAFMKRFGPGELDCWLRISTVLLISANHHALVEHTTSCRDDLPKWTDLNHDHLRRFVYFATNVSGEPYAWDPEEASDADTFDHPIYRLHRHEEGTPDRLASTFTEFIQITVDELIEWRAGEPLDPSEPVVDGCRFEPAFLRFRTKPTTRDVKRWLAFNNHTARDLARAIRNEGRTEAFPILADALEEAGCDNADVLDSCRTGDSDVDGVWVLRVLLGDRA
ncbi:Uncharacterized protein OS=uncultured bacterium PE=4 SV=1: SMI1_KNR4 [Gemmataceae bacterium]|nr:Uncharacterized protein OS=uncultured bacterium PE=4 SV=1: SMI1_KNR4 [Gemmataceae bacterium]VTU01848.1 Uncharacterized protein OS=uncultured bacterium PE=4 SV=1: SMI1_KNR4 [Gemmataceae bacterium]